MVNGKRVFTSPALQTTEKTIADIQRQSGPKVVRETGGGQKKSSLDFKARDSTDRWSLADTKQFYKALQLIGTDFGVIETLFNGKRTRNQIKVSRNSIGLFELTIYLS